MSGEVVELERLMDFAPAEWRQVTLGKVVRIVTDGISAADLAALPKVHHYSLPAFDEGAGPEVGPGDTIKSNKTVVPDDCVLFSKLNPRIPRIWRVRGDAPPHSYCSTEFWPLVAQGSGVDLDYLTHYLSSAAFLGHPDITPSSSTNSHQRVDRKAFERFEFVLPPLDEQRRIAEVLRSMDEAIAAKSAVIAQAKHVLSNVREAILQPCGPGIDQVPEGWARKRLAEVCRLWNGRAYKKEELLDHGKYKVLRVGNFFTNDKWYYSDLELEGQKYCDDGDLLYAWSASFGPRVWAGGKVIYHYHIWKITVDDRLIEKDFLFHFLDWDAERIKNSMGSGSTMIHVTKGAMEQRAISLPPLDEQRSIANTLSTLHHNVSMAKADLEKASQLKAALMSDLLSGRVRVPA